MIKKQLKINNFFITAVSKLSIDNYHTNDENNILNESTNTICNIIEQLKKQPSIHKIRNNIQVNEKFSFKTMASDQVENAIKNLNTHKATHLWRF